MTHRQPAPLRSRTLFLEPLESRVLLAGDVSVSVHGGHLKLRGDSECNGLLVVQLSAGRYAVVGFVQDGAPTTINGQSDPVIVRGVDGNFDIDLRKGDDLLGIGNDVELLASLADDLGFDGAIDGSSTFGLDEIPDRQLQVPLSLLIKTKDGEDGVVVSADVRYDAVINTGKHADGVAIARSEIGGSAIIHTEKGQDGVLIDDSAIRHHLHVNTGKDGDTLLVSRASIAHAVLITGHGSDSLGVSDTELSGGLVLLTEQGSDEVVVGQVAARRIDLHTGAGSDDVLLGALSIEDDIVLGLGAGHDEAEIFDTAIGRNLIAILGAGDDDFTADNVGVGHLAHINGGAGHDDVSISASDVDELFEAILGSGRDVLSIFDSTAERASLHGGSNFDVLNVDELNVFEDVNQSGFEDVNVVV